MDDNDGDLVTVRAWLDIITEYREAAWIDIQTLRNKLEAVDFLDCPISLLNTMKDQLADGFKMTIKERAFILRALEIYNRGMARRQ